MSNPKNEPTPVAPGAVELNEAELDNVAGGAETVHLFLRGSRPVAQAGDGSVKPVDLKITGVDDWQNQV